MKNGWGNPDLECNPGTKETSGARHRTKTKKKKKKEMSDTVKYCSDLFSFFIGMQASTLTFVRLSGTSEN